MPHEGGIHDPNGRGTGRHEGPVMSVGDFSRLGLEEAVYVRPLVRDGATVYAIFAADGRQIALAQSVDDAYLWARAEEMSLQPVH